MHIPLALSPRRAGLLITTLALLVLGALILGNASGAGARPAAHLVLVMGNPVTVSGHGFRGRRRVQLILVDRGTMTRRPTTDRSGAFTVTFPTTIDRCSGWSVTATQPGRAMVALRSPAKPECAPLRTP